MKRKIFWFLVLVAVIALGILFGGRLFKVVPADHVAVAALTPRSTPRVYEPRLHIPVNPLLQWHLFDTRETAQALSVAVAAQDQIPSRIDVSLRYRILPDRAADVFEGAGRSDQVQARLVEPAVAEVVADLAGQIARTEDLYQEASQPPFQERLAQRVADRLRAHGVLIEEVRVGEVRLPALALSAVQESRDRRRIASEQQQRLAQAEADLAIARTEAEQIRVLAEARAEEIRILSQALGEHPGFLRYEALRTLQRIAQDPAAKIYIVPGDATGLLPRLPAD